MHRESKISVGSIVFLVWILVTSCENKQYHHHYYYHALLGYYMYIEVTPRRQGDNAKLQVSVSGNGAAACLVFFYHMYGDAIGTLNVYSGNQLVFSVSGNQGNYWIQARKTIYLRHSVSFWSSVLKKTRLLVLVNFQTAKICTYTYTYLQRSVEKPKYIN